MQRKRMTGRILIGVLILITVSGLFAQQTNIQVNGKDILNTITYIASDEFMGRRPITPEFAKAQDWVVKNYEKWGLQPAGENNSFFQDVPVMRDYSYTYGIPELVIDERAYYTYQDDFTMDVCSTPGFKKKTEIIFTGYGISAPDKGLDEYAGVDVNGKLVFVLQGNPNDFEAPPMRLMPDYDESAKADTAEATDWQMESTDSTKIMTAYEHGAAGILLYNPVEDDNPFRRYRRQINTYPFEHDFAVITDVNKCIFNWILWRDKQMSSRGFETWFNGVREDIKNKTSRSFNTGLKTKVTGFDKILLRGEHFDKHTGRNIITKIPGADPELKNEYVVIGAHFDHIGVTNGQIYNGAEDNGSGSGVVIELAKLMAQNKIQPKRTIILCLWTAEELGLIGSRHWVSKPTDGVTMDKVVGYFNLDMVGKGNYIDAPGALNFPSIWEVIKKDQTQAVIEAVKPSEGGPGGSDYSAFMEHGVEALGLMTHGPEGHPDYHDTGDDANKLNADILGITGQFVLQGALNLANDTESELLIPDRIHIFDGLNWHITVIDPNLDIQGSWECIKADNTGELAKLMTEEVEKLKNPDNNADPLRAMRRRFGRVPRNNGICGAKSFGYDTDMMNLAKETLNFGRIDINGDDGVWFNNGLTEAGAQALSAIRKSRLALHLVNPSTATLEAVLEKSRKTFLVSGIASFDDAMLAKIKDSDVLIGVDFDPENVQVCVDQLEMYKSKLDSTDKLVLNVTNKNGLDQGKRELYLALIKKGWTKDEIYPIGGAGLSRRSQGNLDVLPGGPPPFRFR
jgi:hypothetical protein